MNNIRTIKIDGQEFVPYKDYLRLKDTAHEELSYLKEVAETVKELEQENEKLKKEKQELEYLWDINEEVKQENEKLKYVIDSVMEKAGIEYIRLADWDVFMNPKNKLQISDTIQIDILNGKQ